VDAVNSPTQIAKGRAALPLAAGRLQLSSAVEYMNSRQTYTGGRMRPVLLGDVTLSTHRLFREFDLQLGIRNVAGWRYSDPAGLALGRVPGQGREVFLKLIWHTIE
jgi:hypothetical protein